MRDTTREQFLAFHAQHPDLYRTLVEMAYQWLHSGREQCSIGMLYEVVRWQTSLATNDLSYRLNDCWQPWYARLIMQQEPRLAGIFQLRSSRADEL